MQIEGTIVAPDEPEKWDPKFQRQWLEFTKLNAVTFQGDGVIDGSGDKWWAESCKKNKSRVNFLIVSELDSLAMWLKWYSLWFSGCFSFQPCKGAPTVRTKLLSSEWKPWVFMWHSDLRAFLQALTIDSSSNIRVKGLTIQNSQQMHFTIARSESVRVTEVRVSAPGDSPNTDGIHITQSTNVVIQNCKISTGSHSDLHQVIIKHTHFLNWLKRVLI